MKKVLFITFTLLTAAVLASCVINQITMMPTPATQPAVLNTKTQTQSTLQQAHPAVQKAIPTAPSTTSKAPVATPTRGQSPTHQPVPKKYTPPTITRKGSPTVSFAPAGASVQSLEQDIDPKKVCIKFNLSTQTGSYVYDDLQLYSFQFSSGKMGYDTPTGTYYIGAKDPMKWSTEYKCVMPFSMNLGIVDTVTGLDRGIYVHEGRVPEGGYPASHRCIRLKPDIAKKLFGAVPSGSKVVISGETKDYWSRFPGYNLLTFDSHGVPRIKRNAEGGLTQEFIDYTINNKMEVYTRSPSGKKVDKEQGVLSFEFMEDPWQQGVSVKDYRRALSGN